MHIDDDTDQHAGYRLAEERFSGLRNWRGWGSSLGACQADLLIKFYGVVTSNSYSFAITLIFKR
ncbi:hypothetical protein [Phaeovulum sp. NW3]|uniref:hypothetical protein n=1 Tax=Phaeovulum sp. NW3 TaxID=2934933 RepID=UPI002021F07E|nr:hypothetical protein [Phaeovulum sp. NW3]